MQQANLYIRPQPLRAQRIDYIDGTKYGSTTTSTQHMPLSLWRRRHWDGRASRPLTSLFSPQGKEVVKEGQAPDLFSSTPSFSSLLAPLGAAREDAKLSIEVGDTTSATLSSLDSGGKYHLPCA